MAAAGFSTAFVSGFAVSGTLLGRPDVGHPGGTRWPTWSKRCGHMAGKSVVPTDEWLAKLRAALRHREGIHVTARTDARAAGA
ncbi:MAG: hypothetical protein ACKOCE_10710 [Acidimicrobiia bacterium]